MSDHYRTLGIQRGASADEIRDAYRKLAREFHPDRNKSPGAEARFKEINEAHEVLSDADKKRQYDQFGFVGSAAGGAGGSPFPGGFGGAGGGGGGPYAGGFSGFAGAGPDLRDVMEGLFGGFGGFGDAGPATGPRGGRGAGRRQVLQEATLELTLEEAFAGGPRSMRVQAGRGKPRNVTFELPPRLRDGQQLQVEGEPLVITFRIKPHERYRFMPNGEDLEVTLPIAAWDAALGAEVPLETLDGRVMLTVKAGSSSGKRWRIPKRGWRQASGARGDLYVEARVIVPENPAPAERELWEQLRAASTLKSG